MIISIRQDIIWNARVGFIGLACMYRKEHGHKTYWETWMVLLSGNTHKPFVKYFSQTQTIFTMIQSPVTLRRSSVRKKKLWRIFDPLMITAGRPSTIAFTTLLRDLHILMGALRSGLTSMSNDLEFRWGQALLPLTLSWESAACVH